MSECIFCKIAAGDVASNICYQDDDVVAFHDVNPQAPMHVLVVPRKHLASLNDADESDAKLLGQLMLAGRRVAHDLDCGESYRVVNNCGKEAGQSVFHVHLHVLAGRPMTWPPG